MTDRIARKVWASHEAMPHGDKLHNATTAPAKWFCEHVEYAAELYGLELGTKADGSETQYTIYVLDTQGSTHEFQVKVHRQLVARVTATARRDP